MDFPKIVIPDIHIHVNCGCQQPKPQCPEELAGLVFSTGPDCDHVEEVYPLEGETDLFCGSRLERVLANRECCPDSPKGAATMEKKMLTMQRTTARIISGVGVDGNPIPLPTVYDIQWAAETPGVVNLDVNGNGELGITSSEVLGSTDITATISFVRNGAPKTASGTFTLTVVDREKPPVDPEIVGLLIEVDNPVDLQPNNPEILVQGNRRAATTRKVSVSRSK